MHKEKDVLTVVLTVLGILFVISLFWVFPTYNVWSREMNGKAELAEAQWNRQIQIEEAQANLESEKLNAQSEIERAKGAAEAIKIEGGSLTDNYIKYLWVRQLSSGEKQLIYVPTEAGLPILESTRLIK
jgi:ABC-type glycerol-3-phosphate transport system permease component